jgi:hypothetical protein
MEMNARLRVLDELVQRMDHRLFGNGREGEIGCIKKRISRLEVWSWRAAGAIGLLVFFKDAALALLRR